MIAPTYLQEDMDDEDYRRLAFSRTIISIHPSFPSGHQLTSFLGDLRKVGSLDLNVDTWGQ